MSTLSPFGTNPFSPRTEPLGGPEENDKADAELVDMNEGKNPPVEQESQLTPPPEGVAIQTLIGTSLLTQTVATTPPITTFASFFTRPSIFAGYQTQFTAILINPEDRTAFLEAVHEATLPLPNPAELVLALFKMQIDNIPLTKKI